MRNITVTNLYLHADGGYYCLLIDDAPMKHPDSGEWLPGVIYVGADGQSRSTSRARWDERFTQVQDVHPENLSDDEMAMVRRCNPGDSDLDFIRVFESWHESEINITGNMLELAVGAVMEKWTDSVFGGWNIPGSDSFTLTITTEDLQNVLQNYDIKRVPEPHGFRFEMRKSFPNETDS